MTAALAIAATSEVLRYIVESAMSDVNRTYGIQAPTVTTGAPPKPAAADGAEAPIVNLFAYLVTPNAAYRTPGTAVRDASGARLHNAPLVLNLEYLVSAHGPEAVREIGLATALHALHQVGIVPRPVIRDALQALVASPNQYRKAIGTFDRLADQLESLTLSPASHDLDAMTKLWTATQAPLRPAACYLVTTVFLEQARPQRTALPVTQPVGLTTVATRTLAITGVEGQKAGRRWPITADAWLIVVGDGVDSDALRATLGGVALTPVPGESRPGRLVLDLPAVAADLRAGAQSLDLALNAPGPGGRVGPVQTASTQVFLRPAPAVAATAFNAAGAQYVSGTLTLDVTPPIARAQAVTLRLAPVDPQAGLTPIAVSWTAPAPGNPPVDTFTQLEFTLTKARRGWYRVQLEVAGVLSQPMPDNAQVFQPTVELKP